MLINKKSGLNLTESVVILAIMSVLLMISYNGFGTMTDKENLKSSTQQVAFALKKARSYVTSKGVATKVDFNVGCNTFSVKTIDNSPITDNNNFDAMSGKLGDNVTIESNTCSNLGFDMDGAPIDTVTKKPRLTDCKIELQCSGQVKSIVIQAETGNITYEE